MTIDVIGTARRRSRRLASIVAAASAVIALAVCGAALYLGSRPAHNDTTPRMPSALGASPSGAPVDLVLPANLVWVRVAGVALPVSAGAGPGAQRDGRASGFAHTPAGALLAAVHLLVRTTPQVGAGVFGPTLREQVVGSDAPAMAAAVSARYRQLGGSARDPIGTLRAGLAGARLTSYSDNRAVFDLLTVVVDATGSPRFAATTITTVWTGADWALLAPPYGVWDSLVRPVDAADAATYPTLTEGR